MKTIENGQRVVTVQDTTVTTGQGKIEIPAWTAGTVVDAKSAAQGLVQFDGATGTHHFHATELEPALTALSKKRILERDREGYLTGVVLTRTGVTKPERVTVQVVRGKWVYTVHFGDGTTEVLRRAGRLYQTAIFERYTVSTNVKDGDSLAGFFRFSNTGYRPQWNGAPAALGQFTIGVEVESLPATTSEVLEAAAASGRLAVVPVTGAAEKPLPTREERLAQGTGSSTGSG